MRRSILAQARLHKSLPPVSVGEGVIMRISELVSHWERDAKGRMSQTSYNIPLDVESAARLAALAEMYPKRSTEALLGELVGAALEAVETSLPYVRGTQVIATDEQGDPVYEESEHAIGKSKNLLKAA